MDDLLADDARLALGAGSPDPVRKRSNGGPRRPIEVSSSGGGRHYCLQFLSGDVLLSHTVTS
ncbi:hypothetical protein, partial [Kineosporia sp. NBRC 101731]|uniref:hypothetical protein n=1 Tax=Kineosporia sp. NBRC 101731 TaxID=3032199 RepID=UPI00255468CF